MISVSACLVTRGDVPLDDILKSLTAAGIDDIVVWDNSKREDLTVYGRYAAISEAKHDLIFTQDDDCIVSDPLEIVSSWHRVQKYEGETYGTNFVVCNMPPEFRQQPFYENCALVGFGAVFHRNAPSRAFAKLLHGDEFDFPLFHRRCDIAFTALTPRVLVDVPKTNMWWAENSMRMYRQENHLGERKQMLDLALKARDGA